MKLKKTIGRTNSISNAQLINPHANTTDTDAVKRENSTDTKEFLAEKFLNDFSISMLPSAGDTTYDSVLLRKDLTFLNQKLETVRKTVTAWDVYNILGVAETGEQVNSWLNTLSPNSSFIVNTPETYTTLDKKKYSIGDIVFKDIGGNNHIIKAQGAGVYYPQNLELIHSNSTSNTYKLTYTFSTVIPTEDPNSTLDEAEMSADAKIAYYMKKSNLVMQNETNPYGYHQELEPNGSFIVPLQNKIKPVIYIFFEVDKSKYERIYMDEEDLTCKKESDSQLSITNNSPLNILVEVR